ncbi:helix-turn-helix transcriptional regulator [Actinoallomurus acanthiterrae]
MAPAIRPLAAATLTARDLDRVLRLLEDCEQATTLAEFRIATLEGLARHLGYRNATFFVGPNLPQCFADPSGMAYGRATRLLNQYQEHYWRNDIFSQPQALVKLREQSVVILDDLPVPSRAPVQHYLDDFLMSNGIRAKLVTRLATPPDATALMGLIDAESGAFGPRDLALAGLLARHLGNLLRHYTQAMPVSLGDSGLSPRETEVVRLVAEGFSNQQIAAALFITTSTVKKHLTSAMRASGCSNRTELALTWKHCGPHTA